MADEVGGVMRRHEVGVVQPPGEGREDAGGVVAGACLMAGCRRRVAERDWLERLVSRRVPLSRFAGAIHAQPDDIKVVLTFE
ncbi:hypothetical protein AB0J27_11355 [Micromonospora chokoriensis]